MKKKYYIILSLLLLIIFNTNLKAQHVKNPLASKEKTETIPVSPGENWSWVKAHWEWDGGKYKWIKGIYIETREGYLWIDGEWERNQKTGWWQFNEGYWQKDNEQSSVKNKGNTTEDTKVLSEKSQKNKPNGLFIKTGSSK